MKKKISIMLLLALVTTMMSLTALANEENVLLISPKPIKENVLTNEYDIMPISLDEYDTMLIGDVEELDNSIKVQLDGEYVDFTDENGNVVNPEIINNRTMVPMRKIFEIFSADVNWDNETRTVVAKTDAKEITLTINSDKAKLKNLVTNEEKEIVLDSVPVLLNNRTMVPVRFIAESLEKEVGWDADERTVIIIDFEKIIETIEEKIPTLNKLFELEIETVESFKTKSEITGKITYKDLEEKSNNETVKIDGTLNINMNKEKEIEMYINLNFSGKGAIYNSLKEAGYEKISMGIVISEGNLYMMTKQNGKEYWTKTGTGFDMNQLFDSQMMNQPKNVEQFVDILKGSIGELDITSYGFVQEMIKVLASIYSEDSLEISGTEKNQTIKYSMNLKELLGGLTSESLAGMEGLEMEIETIQKIKSKKPSSVNLTLDMSINEPTTKESFNFDMEIDMKYTETNKDFEINVPKSEVIEGIEGI